MSEHKSACRQVNRVGTMRLNAPPGDVMPLLTALGEYQWIPGWQADFLYPESGEPQQGGVFATTHAPGMKTYWLTLTYDVENYRVSYVNFTADELIMQLSIDCEPGPDNTTIAEWRYGLTALGRHGGMMVDQRFNEAAVQEEIRLNERRLNYTLAHGELPPE